MNFLTFQVEFGSPNLQIKSIKLLKQSKLFKTWIFPWIWGIYLQLSTFFPKFTQIEIYDNESTLFTLISSHTCPVFQPEALIPIYNIPNHPQARNTTPKCTSKLISNYDNNYFENKHEILQ